MYYVPRTVCISVDNLHIQFSYKILQTSGFPDLYIAKLWGNYGQIKQSTTIESSKLVICEIVEANNVSNHNFHKTFLA